MTEELRYDRGEIEGRAVKTDEGYLKADSIVTRTGVFVYQNADGSTRLELRHPDDVFKQSSLDTMKMVPITDGHPSARLVTAKNAKQFSIGHAGENIKVDGKYVRAPLVVTHSDGVDSIDSGRQELSCGYTVDLIKEDGEYNGEKYTHRQTNIRYNHIAIVDRGRAGPKARIQLDSADAFQTEKGAKMTTDLKLKTVSLDGIDYQASPEVVNALTKANARADEADKAKATAEAALKTKTDEADKLKADLDVANEKATSTKSDEAVREAVKARVALERVAAKVLKADAVEKLDSMSDLEIKKAVIAEKAPNAKLDGQSEVYIQSRFDHIAEDVAAETTQGDQRKAVGERVDGKDKETKTDAAGAMEALKAMHLNPEKK